MFVCGLTRLVAVFLRCSWDVLADDDPEDEPTQNEVAAANPAESAAAKKRRRKKKNKKKRKKKAAADADSLGNPGSSVDAMIEDVISHGFSRKQVMATLDRMWNAGLAYDSKDAILAELTKPKAGKPKQKRTQSQAAAMNGGAHAAAPKQQQQSKKQQQQPQQQATRKASTDAAAAPKVVAAAPAAPAVEDPATTAERLRTVAALPKLRQVLQALLQWRRQASAEQVSTFFTCGALDTILENVLRHATVADVQELRNLLKAMLVAPNSESVRCSAAATPPALACVVPLLTVVPTPPSLQVVTDIITHIRTAMDTFQALSVKPSEAAYAATRDEAIGAVAAQISASIAQFHESVGSESSVNSTVAAQDRARGRCRVIVCLRRCPPRDPVSHLNVLLCVCVDVCICMGVVGRCSPGGDGGCGDVCVIAASLAARLAKIPASVTDVAARFQRRDLCFGIASAEKDMYTTVTGSAAGPSGALPSAVADATLIAKVDALSPPASEEARSRQEKVAKVRVCVFLRACACRYVSCGWLCVCGSGKVLTVCFATPLSLPSFPQRMAELRQQYEDALEPVTQEEQELDANLDKLQARVEELKKQLQGLFKIPFPLLLRFLLRFLLLLLLPCVWCDWCDLRALRGCVHVCVLTISYYTLASAAHASIKKGQARRKALNEKRDAVASRFHGEVSRLNTEQQGLLTAVHRSEAAGALSKCVADLTARLARSAAQAEQTRARSVVGLRSRTRAGFLNAVLAFLAAEKPCTQFIQSRVTRTEHQLESLVRVLDVRWVCVVGVRRGGASAHIYVVRLPVRHVSCRATR